MSKPTSWDDEGFDANDGGFAPGSTPTPDPIPEPVSAAATAPSVEPVVQPVMQPVVDAPKTAPRIMVTPPGPAAGSTTVPDAKQGNNRTGKIFLLLALLAIVIGGGYILSTFFLRDPIEDKLFYAQQNEGRDTSKPRTEPIVTVVPDTHTVDTTTQPVHDIVQQKPRIEPHKTPAPQKEQPQEAPKPADASGGVWAVQVYSSPSRDDATDWLQTMKQKNVPDGYVTEQEIRGQHWYRVRFGQYTSKVDAETAARRYGFRQPWIARIK